MKLSIVLAALVAFLILLQVTSAAYGRSRITAGEPVPIDHLRSLGDVIHRAKGAPVHILYVHGMRAMGPGESVEFVEMLKRHIGDKSPLAAPHFEPLNLEPWPDGATVGGAVIWDKIDDWKAGQPFVLRHTLVGEYSQKVIVDEVNWWPLLFPLKCRMLVEPEHRLAGVNKAQLNLCARNDPPFHAWITPQQYKDALKAMPPLGGAALANKYLKQEIVDWGLSDAVITVGPMRTYINAAMDAAFDYAAKDRASEFVIISESLGSFALLDAYEDGKPAVKSIMDSTHNLYFFANQFALLELARVTNIPDEAGPPTGTTSPEAIVEVQPAPSPMSALAKWAAAPAPQGLGMDSVKQIIAFSDPSDALTHRVPCIANVKVSNVYVRNATSWLGLLAMPVKAHAGQMSNRALWKEMLRIHKPPLPDTKCEGP